MSDKIVIKGARVHNLKNINLTIPRDKLVVLTGLSGSGKSSLAFDTIYAEGHRRFVESLSSYARMFLGQLDKPDVDSIEGLSPAISIDQKTTSKNPRSTVGTVTEIYDYLRLLYARLGVVHCPVCGKEIKQQSVDQIIDRVLTIEDGTKFMVLAPVVSGKKGRHEKVFSDAKKGGFVRVRVDGVNYDLSEDIELELTKKHNIEIIVDRLIMKEGIRSRLSDSIETSLKVADGKVKILIMDNGNELDFSTNYACEEHGISFGEIEPRSFSFNNPFGACPHCLGIGEMRNISVDKIIPNKELSLNEGAIAVNGFKTIEDESWMGPLVKAVGARMGFDLSTPIKDFTKQQLDALLYGTGDEYYTVDRYFSKQHKRQTVKYEGIIRVIENRMKMIGEEYYDQFIEETPCPVCNGQRLNKNSLSVTIGGKNIDEFCRMSVNEELEFIKGLKFTENESKIAKEILKEIKARLGFMQSVGLEYLTLARKASTLSGGEAQRIRLATQIGSALVGVLYVLDEPSIGLHQRDNGKLIKTLKDLRDVGNSVIVVEHDEETMLESDYIVDIGPGAGVHGGEIVAQGTPEEIMKCEKSITGAYLSGRKRIEVPKERRKGNGNYLIVHGAKENNLKNIDVKFPLGCFIAITGVSGSGKSSLVDKIVYQYLAKKLNKAITYPGKCDYIEGYENLDKVIAIDQSPIGRTPRSNPATYTGLFNEIRDLFSKTPDAKMRSFGPGRFSFNVKGGRCESCQGDGLKKIEMHFLPDVYVKCDVCKGKRYNKDTLEVKFKGKNISDVLEMTAEEGCLFFSEIPSIQKKLQTICDVGLGYIKIGQSSTTLSGGEAQRVKLATELSKKSTGKTIYILDEPTTGLHSEDVKALLSVLQKLVDAGNTVLVIEHNLDVIKSADYIIDLGPEGGENGGQIVATGTPEEVAENEKSYTGIYVKKVLKKDEN